MTASRRRDLLSTPRSANVFSLPVPLILLVHLRILQYPHANKPEYDHNVFDSRVRGLRDRTKTMEDVCYFLVTRIKGKNLRRMYSRLKQPRPDAKAISPLAVAWWWKDVVVRKSLEECAGGRFERLLLARSTHPPLTKGSKSRVEVNKTQNTLRTQPRIYSARLTAFQSCHNSGARVASRLIQQQRDLKVLHFKFLSELSGLDQMESLSNTDHSPSNPTDPDASTVCSATPLPVLPIAAAHHPATLRKLGKRLFPKETVNVQAVTASLAALPYATVALSGLLDERACIVQAVTDAVARTHKVTADLRTRLDRATAKQASTAKRPLRPVNTNLWQDTHQASIDFEHRPTDATFVALGLSAPGSDVPIELRIDEIRRALLPEYPWIPTMPLDTTPSRLPQPSGCRSPPQTPKRARRVETSTPPETVKPRSQPAPQTLDAQRRARNLIMRPSSSDADRRPSFSGPSESSESESERVVVAAAPPHACPKHSLTMTPPPAVDTPYGDQDEDAFDEGPSMNVRDLLLQADMTHFDIINDSEEDSSDVVDQSFGWA
ncbi:hypothetical protein DFH07DRAFT_801216 [Mycena maculata]|uniref:HAUS augmin-like complex subunit 6 N-terminal domain-containing protein n=1 Tax=Mycena maculata TaxID=230809 RepID=A0AAD7JZD7_9AGAR|nr:hypothetical protein DFH07DRAFT_801216 [Mycena maculata]